jgi:potassium-dependent mechanosensitive channel
LFIAAKRKLMQQESSSMQESNFIEMLTHFWNFQLFKVDESPITLGKLVIGFTLVIVSYFLAKWFSRQLGRRLLKNLNLQNSVKTSLERLIFYVGYIVLILFVMQLLSIPITIFTMVGGALAIGIGFGSQNVINNFISGLIVMIEQPVRVGDWIEIEGVSGHIEQIGGRSTYIKTSDNKQVIIPNSFFLEKYFINWTLSDDIVSGRLSVGVAYGTDVKKVEKILLQVAAENQKTLKDPAPAVLFQDFAESSLNFDLVFWHNVGAELTSRGIASQMRYRIDELFKENNISMPFPHRQLVFDSKSPVPVKMQ